MNRAKLLRVPTIEQHAKHLASEHVGQRRFVILRKNVKSEEWLKELRALGVPVDIASNIADLAFGLLGVGSSPLRDGDVIVFRCLNDRHNLFRALAHTSMLCLCIAIARIKRVRVWWIAHNVDRETYVRREWLTLARRALLAKAAERIFVTDRLLIPRLLRIWPRYEDKIRATSFGAPRLYTDRALGNAELIRQLKLRKAQVFGGVNDRRVWIGLCAGRPGAKYLHFQYARALVDAASDQGINVLLAVVGDLSGGPQPLSAESLKRLAEHPRILLIDRYVPLDERGLTGAVDFVWRGYSDWSTSYALYGAAAARIPILALYKGAVGRMVERYELGATTHIRMQDLAKVFARIDAWDPRHADAYLSERTWRAGAEAFAEALHED